MGSNDQTAQIVKGKRTKRPRSASPLGVAMTDSSSSGCGGGGGAAGGERESVTDDYNSISSPTTSGEIYESTEEEEDMANCLIMLARGDASRHVKQEHKRDDDEDAKIEKLGTSRKFSTIVTTTNKAGFFVYECKTCNRSFPSFQALGGHRASHKKPRAAVEEKKSSLVAAVKEDFVQETGNQFNKISGSSPVSLQVSAAANNKGNKVHECSICGSEFTSGQALGGHMRRHRAAAAAVHVTAGNHHQVGAEISSVDTSTTNESKSAGNDQHHHQVKPRSILPLDLNLPAPEDDHHQQLRSDSKFQFGSTQQALVFSAPALVDCHY